MDKHVVVISKAWQSDAPITIDVMESGIAISMPLNAFMDAVAQEAGNPATLLTIAALRGRLERAGTAVCVKMKQETSKVM